MKKNITEWNGGKDNLAKALDFLRTNPHARLFPAIEFKNNKYHIPINWKYESTPSLEALKDWSKEWPGCCFCIDLIRSPYVAIDPDDKAGRDGNATLYELESRFGYLPKTCVSKTPSGKGRHLLFQYDNKVNTGANRLGEGLDVPTMIPLPGQSVKGKGDYSLLTTYDCAPLPPWIAALTNKQGKKSSTPPGDGLLEYPGQLYAALQHIDPDCEYGKWVKVGMALHHASGGGQEGLDMWDAWSFQGSTYRDGEPSEKYETFSIKEESVSARTIFKLARESGWTGEFANTKTGKELQAVEAGRVFGLPPDEINLGEINFEPARVMEAESSHAPSKAATTGSINIYHDVEALPSAPTSWLIAGCIPQDGLTLIYGESGSFKSFVALDMLYAVASNTKWCGLRVTTGPCLYIAGEGGHGLMNRGKAWKAAHRVSKQLPLFFCTMPIAFSIPQQIAELKEQVQKIESHYGPLRALVVDTLAQCFGPGDENSQKDMGAFLQGVNEATGHRGARIILHHTGHSAKDRARGAYALPAALDASFIVKRTERAGSTPGCLLECKKQRDAEFPKTRMFTMKRVTVEHQDNVSATSLVPQEVPVNNLHIAAVKLTPKQKQIIKILQRSTPFDGMVEIDTLAADLVTAGHYSREFAAKRAIQTLIDKRVLSIEKNGILRCAL